MSPHVDVLEQPDRLGKPFVGSILFHVGLALLAGGVTWIESRNEISWVG
jgi:hypothetical protein